jgi:DNA-binding FadR family transcriptional regulator
MLTAQGLLSARPRPRHGAVVEPEAEWNMLDPDVLRWLLKRKFSLRLLAGFTEMRLGIERAAAAMREIIIDVLELIRAASPDTESEAARREA